jgi:hypothetical protein
MLSRKVQAVSSRAIPQFDSIARILQAVTILSRGVLSSDTIDLSPRHVNYVKQAARVLGLLSNTDELTGVGQRAVEHPPERRRKLLMQQFEKSECGKAWLDWAGASDLDGLDPTSGSAFLTACTDLPKSMVARRGRTLRRWAEELRTPQDKPPPTPKSPGGARYGITAKRRRAARGTK